MLLMSFSCRPSRRERRESHCHGGQPAGIAKMRASKDTWTVLFMTGLSIDSYYSAPAVLPRWIFDGL